MSKIQFRPDNFFIFGFKCHKMFRFCKKMPYKNIYFAKLQNISKKDPDPKKMARIRNTGSMYLSTILTSPTVFTLKDLVT